MGCSRGNTYQGNMENVSVKAENLCILGVAVSFVRGAKSAFWGGMRDQVRSMREAVRAYITMIRDCIPSEPTASV